MLFESGADLEELAAERNQATAILESMSEGVLAVDGEGRIVAANPAVRAILGLTVANLIGANLFETLRQREIHSMVRSVLGGQPLVLQDFPIFSPRERILRAQGVACAAAGRGGPRVVLVLQDVTELHRYDQLRREFVANVSHELKSPLTSIRSLTETLLDGALEDESCNRRFVGLIEEDAVRLARLIEDLLVLSQIESRAVPLRLSSVEIAPLVASVLAPLEILVDQKGIAVEVDIPAGLTVSADPDRLRQIFANLIDNGIKYNRPRGKLQIRAARKPDALYISVADEGPGIPPEDRTRIFERFYRVDKTRSRELGGTGLGLSIVKHVVDSHGGRVWVESEPASGSVFYFTLPSSVQTLVQSASPVQEWAAVALEDEPEAFDTALKQLQERLILMAGLVEEAVGRAVRALVIRDGGLARQVLERDDVIDRAELAIDELCLHLLDRYRPEAGDLRFITMAFKINSDLERMGDLAVNIAHRTLELLREPLLRPLIDIPHMAELVQAMVKDSLDALVRRDEQLARDVCGRDDEVDRLNHRVFRHMLASMADDKSSIERAVGLMLVARSLERIADHATNVAEDVVYMVLGKSIKHGRRLDSPGF